LLQKNNKKVQKERISVLKKEETSRHEKQVGENAEGNEKGDRKNITKKKGPRRSKGEKKRMPDQIAWKKICLRKWSRPIAKEKKPAPCRCARGGERQASVVATRLDQYSEAAIGKGA